MGKTRPSSNSNSVRLTRTTFIIGISSGTVMNFLQVSPTFQEAAQSSPDVDGFLG